MVGTLPTQVRFTGALLAAVSLFSAVPVPVVAQDTTTALQVRPTRLLTPGRLAQLGGLVLVSLADDGFRTLVQDARSPTTNQLAQLGNRFGEPRVVFPMLGAAFIAGKLAGLDGVARTTLEAGKAIVLGGAFVQVVKFSVGRARPFQLDAGAREFDPFSARDEFNSFPSGHTTVAFALATVIAERTSGKWGDRLAYAGAGLTAFARVNNDKHWLSDVVVGALVGHLAGKATTGTRVRPAAVPGGVGLALSF